MRVKKFGLSLLFILMSAFFLQGCDFLDRLNGVYEDKELYKKIASADSIIVVNEEGEYQIRIINNTDEGPVTDDHVFSSHWLIEEDFLLPSYDLSYTDKRFKLRIRSFKAVIDSSGATVQPLDGGDEGKSEQTVSENVVPEGAIGFSEESSEMRTLRLTCTGCSNEDKYEIYTGDGTFLANDESVYNTICEGYDNGFTVFYADCLGSDDESYLGVIVGVAYSVPEQDTLNGLANESQYGDAGGGDEGFEEEEAPVPEEEASAVLPQSPDTVQENTVNIVNYFEEGVDGGGIVYMIVDDMGGTYYCINKDMYEGIVAMVAEDPVIVITWGYDVNGYAVISSARDA